MDWILYLVARGLFAGVASLRLRTAARLGRVLGLGVYWLDGRHRRVATQNLTAVFGQEKSPAEIRELARENFRRIGETFVSAIKTAHMTPAEIDRVLDVVGIEKFYTAERQTPMPNRIFAIGHFGNFELFAPLAYQTPGYQFAVTYRSVRPPSLDRLLQSIREESGCLFFERRTDAAKLRAAFSRGGILLGLLSDQHGGHKGIWGPFLGRECSTSPAPALLALRYHCPLYTAFCYRLDLGRWRIEVGDEIPTHEDGRPRSLEAITRDMNAAFEVAVHRDPANWFWVHNRWKSRGRHPKRQARTPEVESASPGESTLESPESGRGHPTP